MASITSLGIGSGLQLESIVEAYIDAEAIPQELRLQEKEERLSLELSGVGSFKSSLATFNDTLEKLIDPDAFNKQVISSSSSAIEVKTNGFASNGSFNVEVNQLATGTRLNSQTFADSSSVVGSGTLTFANGTDAFDVVIDPADSLSAIRDKINAQSENFGVTANIINGGSGSFLVFDSQVTGAANALNISTSDVSLDGISTNNTVVTSAQDAQITIDGTLINSSTNEFKNTIEDVTITAKTVTAASSPAVLSIEQDKESGSELIDEFINGYNALVTELTGLSAPLQGRLAFDPNVRQVKSQLSDIVIQGVTGLTGSLNGLADIGLELNKDGLLQKSTFSSDNIPSGQERLDNALNNNLTDLGEVFASSNGIATQMANMIDSYIASDGVLTQRQTSLNEQVSSIEDEWTELETRLRSYEETLRSQFSFLDATVSEYNATAEWLTSALALPEAQS
ncbi:flagellar filament capping protein FliD [Colwellia sp. E2M01]|uniref:flagellar filament capping protein FliD n=1 Tax=Colwellia sp. E2M01 TaxID=2841561 RepID=UPI001C09B65A|nr:flagellar filament capping protein FliD [Colwellia sp. E2M01]MBU2869976.1 flagellar filament capping protein FliD [Colwellia sp. E2M01]